MLFGAGSTRPVPGEWATREGIPEPGTPGEAAASAALPSKAGGLGTGRRMRGKVSRSLSADRRMAGGKLPLRAAALIWRSTTICPRGLMLCCLKSLSGTVPGSARLGVWDGPHGADA